MKSSYVLIIVIFVILVSATVIAKLGSQIQLAPRRAPVTDFSDEPDVVEEQAEPEPVAPVDFVLGMQESRLTATISKDRMLVRPAADQDVEKITMTSGTLIQDDTGKHRWVIGKSLEVNVAESTVVPLFATSINDTPTEVEVVQLLSLIHI